MTPVLNTQCSRMQLDGKDVGIIYQGSAQRSISDEKTGRDKVDRPRDSEPGSLPSHTPLGLGTDRGRCEGFGATGVGESSPQALCHLRCFCLWTLSPAHL